MGTLTTSSEHRTHDAAPTTDSTPPHGQYRGGAAVSNAGDVAMVGKTLALLSKQQHQGSCDHCYPGLCTVVRGYCSTAALQASGQAAAGDLGLTWLQPDCRSSCRTITAVIQICNYNQNCSTTGVLQLHCTVQLTY